MDELEAILERLEPRLGRPEGGPVALDGGITNRNYRVRMGGYDYVVRLCGKDTAVLGIDRLAECMASERAAELGIGPPVAARIEEFDALVTGFLPGEIVAPERLHEPALLGEIAWALRTMHGGEPLPVTFHVPTLVARQIERLGGAVPAELLDALVTAREIDALLTGPDHEPVPCHNDLLTANFLVEGPRVRLVDWEYAGMNDRFFDLGNFAVNTGLQDHDALLEAYFEEPPTDRRRAALRLMRFMSDLREATWGLVQAEVSDLEFDYPGYAREHLERLQSTRRHPDFDTWMTVAAAA